MWPWLKASLYYSVELSERERTVGPRLRDFLSYDCREVLNSLTVTLLWGREGLSLICTNVIPRQRGLLSVYIYRTICLWVHAQLSFLSFSPNKPTLFCNIAGGVHPASLHIPDLSIWLSSFPLSSANRENPQEMWWWREGRSLGNLSVPLCIRQSIRQGLYLHQAPMPSALKLLWF